MLKTLRTAFDALSKRAKGPATTLAALLALSPLVTACGLKNMELSPLATPAAANGGNTLIQPFNGGDEIIRYGEDTFWMSPTRSDGIVQFKILTSYTYEGRQYPLYVKGVKGPNFIKIDDTPHPGTKGERTGNVLRGGTFTDAVLRKGPPSNPTFAERMVFNVVGARFMRQESLEKEAANPNIVRVIVLPNDTIMTQRGGSFFKSESTFHLDVNGRSYQDITCVANHPNLPKPLVHRMRINYPDFSGREYGIPFSREVDGAYSSLKRMDLRKSNEEQETIAGNFIATCTDEAQLNAAAARKGAQKGFVSKRVQNMSREQLDPARFPSYVFDNSKARKETTTKEKSIAQDVYDGKVTLKQLLDQLPPLEVKAAPAKAQIKSKKTSHQEIKKGTPHAAAKFGGRGFSVASKARGNNLHC